MDYFFNHYQVYTNLNPTDIYPIKYGEEQCTPNHSFGPYVRSSYLIHYIYSGKGEFLIGNKVHQLSLGEMFLIKPGELTFYKADNDEPWLYRWIEFNGSMVRDILNTSIFAENLRISKDNTKKSIGKSIENLVSAGDVSFEKQMCLFWKFISQISKSRFIDQLPPQIEYIKKAENYIKTNIHQKISVYDIAQYIGIDRSYLSRLFKEHKGISPQQFILNTKMNTACYYLKNTDITISEAAQSVGYSDCHVFNKAFKAVFDESPTIWRKNERKS